MRRWFTLAVYLDAARLYPKEWSRALWWRILGKRVRSRAHFAPLLGASLLAYRLWLLEEPVPLPEDEQEGPLIVAFVAAGKGRDNTVRSAQLQGIRVLSPSNTEPSAATDLENAGKPIWLMPLEAGDVLAPDAARSYRALAARSTADLIYADDDLLDARGHRRAPHFKPAWNASFSGTMIMSAGPA